MVQGVYQTILKLTDFSESNQRREQFSLSEQQIDASGIHRFILKYYDQSIAPSKIEEHLICRAVHKLNKSDHYKQINLPEFQKLSTAPHKQVVVQTSTPGIPSSWIDRREAISRTPNAPSRRSSGVSRPKS